jgi:glycine/serine hydroxymethyltransferase
MKEREMLQIADFMETILQNIADENIILRTKQWAIELCSKFPLPY